jgi:uncharacterized protein
MLQVMTQASREFQIFTKPTGAICNLACKYCYYLEKESLYPGSESPRMSEKTLEAYIKQHISAAPGTTVNFSWHGGEPTLMGLDFYKRIVDLQHQHCPSHRRTTNSIQTNGFQLDESWCQFFAEEKFTVGLSLDGPQAMHNEYRVTRGQKTTHAQVMRTFGLLQKHQVPVDILCVVHALNVEHPLEVYRFFKQLKVTYLGLLPLVERQPDNANTVTERTVPAEAFGVFLSTIFDEWKQRDIGRVIVQTIEEAIKTGLGEEHALCIFRKQCGDVPVVEHNGDFYSCDHYVTPDYRLGNILNKPLVDMLESPEQKAFGQAKWDTLPQYCLDCEVLEMCHGECPKNRFIQTPDGESGLNYLCVGYRKFFNHCQSFVDEISRQAQKRQASAVSSSPKPPPASTRTVGRNDPCPCGSGKKYKKCCLGR